MAHLVKEAAPRMLEEDADFALGYDGGIVGFLEPD